MTHSEAFVAAKFGGFHAAFTNEYLLKHGNFFVKPTLHPEGFIYPAISDAVRYQNLFKCEPLPDSLDAPLNFAVKQEKPPTPPTSTSPSDLLKSPESIDGADSTQMNGQSKNGTWILGKQKLSWDNSTVASYNPDTKMFRCVVCNAVGFLSRIAEHYLGTHTSAKVFQCLQCPYSSTWSRCVRMHMAKHHGTTNAPPSLWKGQPLLEEIFQLLTNLKTTIDSQGRERLDPEVCDKKFVCPKCPYTTDRRDLYLRHENIHKEDKPYHCYICFKLFNRADHVKKHFLRIHRGHPYDISLVRRRPPRLPSSQADTAIRNGNGNGVTSKVSHSFTVEKLIASDSDRSTNEVMDLSLRESSPSDSGSTSGKHPKTFQCPYCEWEGVDSWCLRRHMNVHLKTFECSLCDMKTSKAERLFTHVYRAHKKLICTKCKFMTDLAQDFEVHIKDCCLEMVAGKLVDKISEDSFDDSDTTPSPDDLKVESLPDLAIAAPPFVLPLPSGDRPKGLDPNLPLDLKGSVSLMPLHNSISYCYPAPQGFVDPLPDPGLSGAFTTEALLSASSKSAMASVCKVDLKSELASPVQSSSDSGVTDLTSDNNDQDFVCYHCGCEFANMSSLQTHTELYHRDSAKESQSSASGAKKPATDSANGKTKRFSCAICNFNSDKQRTIIEHMRFHTGEVLHCQAGPPCAFKTVCDSTLEKHVQAEHNDSTKRCPHCGFHCTEKIPFIRHYRKCHHSKSCSRCREIKHSLDPKLVNRELSLLLESSKNKACSIVLPYLHRNPYSRKGNGIMPYAHCDSAMSKVAVAIPQALQRTADAIVVASPTQEDILRERKSRKQTMPRKLLPTKLSKSLPSRLSSTICDKKKKRKKGKTNKSLTMKKLLKNTKQLLPLQRRCRLNHEHHFRFKNSVSFVRHSYWCRHAKKYLCRKCSLRFRHEYQSLLHYRREHEIF